MKNATANSVLSQLDYTYHAVGNPSVITKLGGALESYEYDTRDRLISVCYQASCPGPSDPFVRWTYDGVGNRMTEVRPAGTTAYTYDAADQLTQSSGPSGSRSYTYDARGNETQNGPRTFTYDLANRVVSTAAGGTSTTYSYDGDGNRIASSSGSESASYVWDEANAVPLVALERDGSGATIRTYIHGIGPIAFTTSGHTYYLLHDRLGSTINVTSETGQQEWTFSYEPFGLTRTIDKVDPSACESTRVRWGISRRNRPL